MNSSVVELEIQHATNVSVTDDSLIVDLNDGRTISVPLAWYPRLLHGTEEERKNWRLIGLVLGKPSGESQTSFKKWLSSRSGD